jgi:endonuclease YncB( thermonuclease family)
MAWHYKKYASEQPKTDREIYAQAEQLAKSQGIGLWRDKNPMPPWDFRQQTK